jgi:hypothetical protein
MTIILAIDPGKTIGWAQYDPEHIRPIASGNYEVTDLSGDGLDSRLPAPAYLPPPDYIVIERPVGQGPTRPEMVDCGIVAGELWASARELWPWVPRRWLRRVHVRQCLQEAVHGTILVRNDSAVWAAVVALHGDGSDRRGRKATKKDPGVEPGPLAGVSSHARAAVATAVAFALRHGLWKPPTQATGL